MSNLNRNFWAQKAAERQKEFHQPKEHLEIFLIEKSNKLPSKSDVNNNLLEIATKNYRLPLKECPFSNMNNTTVCGDLDEGNLSGNDQTPLRMFLAQPIMLNTPKSSLKRPSTSETPNMSKRVRFEGYDSPSTSDKEQQEIISDLAQKLQQEENKNRDNEQKIGRLNKEKRKLESNQDGLEKQIFELKSTNLNSATSKESSKKMKENAQMIESLTFDLTAKTTECDKIKLELDEVKSHNQELSEQNLELETQIAEKEASENERFKKRMDEIKAQMTERVIQVNKCKDAANLELKNKLSEAKQSNDELEQALTQEKQLNVNFQQQIEDCLTKINVLNSTLLNQATERVIEVKNLEVENDQLMSRFNDQVKVIEQLNVTIKSNNDHLNMLKESVERESKLKKSYYDKFRDLQATLNATKTLYDINGSVLSATPQKALTPQSQQHSPEQLMMMQRQQQQFNQMLLHQRQHGNQPMPMAFVQQMHYLQQQQQLNAATANNMVNQQGFNPNNAFIPQMNPQQIQPTAAYNQPQQQVLLQQQMTYTSYQS